MLNNIVIAYCLPDFRDQQDSSVLNLELGEAIQTTAAHCGS